MARISWHVGKAIDFPLRDRPYDIVVMYGLMHCMPNRNAINQLIDRAIASTAPGGLHILVTFNDRSQDLARAHPDFHPTLLPHAVYIDTYAKHEVIHATDTILQETHPHNGIPHHHSLSRMVVKIR